MQHCCNYTTKNLHATVLHVDFLKKLVLQRLIDYTSRMLRKLTFDIVLHTLKFVLPSLVV